MHPVDAFARPLALLLALVGAGAGGLHLAALLADARRARRLQAAMLDDLWADVAEARR